MYKMYVFVCFAVVEVNVFDTSASSTVEDVTFPKLDPTRQSSWNAGGNSIRLTGDTIRELGADGWSFSAFQFSGRLCCAWCTRKHRQIY